MYKKLIFASVLTLMMQSQAQAFDLGEIVGTVVQKGVEFKAERDEKKAAKKAEEEMKRTGKMPVATEKKPSLLTKLFGKKPAKKVAATPAPVAAPAMPAATPAVVTPPKVVTPVPTPMPAAPVATPAAPVLTTPVAPAAGLAVADPNKK